MQIQAPQGPPPPTPLAPGPVGTGPVGIPVDGHVGLGAAPQGALPQEVVPADVGSGFVDAMQHLGWVDITALGVIGVFCLIGLFKGFLWQTSRVAILGAAYAAAASLGQGLADVLVGWTHSGPVPPTADQRETAYYIACVLIFLGVLIALSLLALLLQNLIQKAGLGFYDRLGGGAVGVATGGLVVLLMLSLLLMFFPRSHVAEAASASHSMRWSQKAIAALGNVMPTELRRLFDSKAAATAKSTGTDAHGGVAPLPAEPAATQQPPRAPRTPPLRDH